MKRLIFLLCLLPVLGFGQIWKGTGISYTRTIPSHNPGTTGAWVAIDTLSGDWYEWQPIGQTWREMGDRIQFSYVSGAPSWIPNKQRSRFVLNAGDSLYVYQGGWVLLNPSAVASYNTSLTYNKPTLSLTDAGGTLTATIPDTSGSNYTMTFSNDTLRLTDQSGTLAVRIPTGGGGGSDTSGYNQSLTYLNDTLTITDGQGSLSVEIPQPVFPANLVLFATTASDTVATYGKLVTSLDDPNYDDPAVNVSTGVITTNQIVGRQISAFGLIVGNPGVISVQTIGEVRRTAGTGTAEFYFEVYQRAASGVETLLATSNTTPPVSSSAYTEFQASALLNNGSWGLTDRIVIKFYANRVVGGSDPTYDFLFGGTNPIRTTFPVPASLLANVPVVVGVTDVQGYVSNRVLQANAIGKIDTTNIVWTGGRMGINTTPQAGVDIRSTYGDALSIRDTAGTQLWKFKNDATFTNDAGFSVNGAFISGNFFQPYISGQEIAFALPENASSFGATFSPLNTVLGSSGNYDMVNMYSDFNGTGTKTYNDLGIYGTINQSGTGATRGILIDKTILAANDYRAIEFTNSAGFGLYGSGAAKNYLSGKLGIGTANPAASAILDLTSTTTGFLPPRMTTSQRNAITPATGLQIYNTSTNVMQHYDGTSWRDEVQSVDTFSIVSDSLRLSLTNDGVAYSAVSLGDYKQTLSVSGDSLFISNGNGVQLPPTTIDTSTYLTQDTILIYYANGIEFGRDTIRAGGGASLSGGVADYLVQWTGASTVDTSGVIWTGGRLGVRTAAPAATLEVMGSGSTSATSSLLVDNSAGRALLQVKDDGAIEVGRNASGTTQATASVTVTGSETNIGLALVPKGEGALTLAIPDGTNSGGGNARGSRAIDLTLSRNIATEVASGDESIAIGNYCRATSNSSVSVGHGAVSTGAGAIAIGGARILGYPTATGVSAVAIGQLNTASASYSTVIGGLQGVAYLFGMLTRSSGRFSANSDAQTSDIRYRRAITGTSQSELFIDGSSTRAILSLPSGATAGRIWNAKIQVVAIVTVAGTADTIVAGSSFIGNYAVGIKRIGNTTSLVGSVQDLHTAQADNGMGDSVVTIDADDTNEALRIQFTPPADAESNTVIRVVATVYLTEVGY